MLKSYIKKQFLRRSKTSSDVRGRLSLLGARFVGSQCANKRRIAYLRYVNFDSHTSAAGMRAFERR